MTPPLRFYRLPYTLPAHCLHIACTLAQTTMQSWDFYNEIWKWMNIVNNPNGTEITLRKLQFVWNMFTAFFKDISVICVSIRFLKTSDILSQTNLFLNHPFADYWWFLLPFWNGIYNAHVWGYQWIENPEHIREFFFFFNFYAILRK